MDLKPKVILDNKCWIPASLLSLKRVRSRYLVYRYEEKACIKCEHQQEKGPNDEPYYLCESCAGFLGKYKLYERKEINGVPYIGFHNGDRLNLCKKLKLDKSVFKNTVDNRIEKKFKYDINFTGTLRPHQIDALKQWNDYNFGQLMAPPRSGKTVLAVNLTVNLKVRTLILTHQGDLLDQMLQSFYDFTDIKDVEFEHKKQLVGIAKKPEDFKKWPIVLATYQKFITPKGKKRLEKIVKKFGLVIVDEVHRANSTCFSAVLAQFHAKYKIGFTATPKRKDCFIKGTQVLLSNGEYAPIEELAKNPEKFSVKTFNHSLGVIEDSKILLGHTRKKSSLIKIKYKGDYIVCTPDQQFWSKTRKAYINAKDLELGEEILDFSDIA
jgi:hypothetical protein